jgi:2-keto-4-pentenoate hydratase/2-oxohepta-3-ene-1,7-dioic acid hydratase in catechol pathway
VTYGLFRARDPQGRARWLMRGVDGGLRDLTAHGLTDDLGAAAAWLLDARRRKAELLRAPRAEAGAETWQLELPGRPGKVLCVGRNFAAHARELHNPVPEELLWFAKLPSVLVGPEAEIRLPRWLKSRVDPETELVALIGRAVGDGASPAEAAGAVAGYSLGFDLTARAVQGDDKQKGLPWTRSKNLPGFGVIGPAWVPADRLAPLAEIVLEGVVNGEVRQRASLGEMLRPPGVALAEIAHWTPLEPGDVLFLGTPAGVAAINRGDRLEARATELGTLRCRIA